MNGQLTNEDNMIVELALILTLPVQFRHLLKAVKHALHDAIVRSIDAATDLQAICAGKLALDARNINGEVLNEMHNAASLLRIKPRLFNAFDLLVLPDISVQKAAGRNESM